MGSKKQQTFAKLQRERKVKERRQMKQEKKQARKLAAANGDSTLTGLEEEANTDLGTIPAPPE
jgi:hypothetical protein